MTEETIKAYWQKFISTLPVDSPYYLKSYLSEGWGDSPEMADELGALIAQGTKTGTCSALWEWEAEGDPIPEVGLVNIVLDGKDPGLLTPEVMGEINLNLDGRLLWSETRAPEAVFKANLLESRLHDKSLAGALEGSWKENLLHIAHLRLRGQGFHLQGKGPLQEKINLEGEVTDLSRLIAQAKGQISAAGWLRYQEDRLSGMISAEGKELEAQGIKAGDLRADFHIKEYGAGISPVLSLEARAGNIKTGTLDFSSIGLQAAGSPGAARLPGGVYVATMLSVATTQMAELGRSFRELGVPENPSPIAFDDICFL